VEKPVGHWTYSSRKPLTIGWRAARMLGKKPPSSPRIKAYTIPCTASCGVTANAKVIWLNEVQFSVDA